MPPRALREKEVKLLSALLAGKPNYQTLISQLAEKVKEMNDGGMGSLRFINSKKEPQHYGTTLAEAETFDEDEVLISITVNLDKDGDLYELDIWK